MITFRYDKIEKIVEIREIRWVSSYLSQYRTDECLSLFITQIFRAGKVCTLILRALMLSVLFVCNNLAQIIFLLAKNHIFCEKWFSIFFWADFCLGSFKKCHRYSSISMVWGYENLKFTLTTPKKINYFWWKTWKRKKSWFLANKNGT